MALIAALRDLSGSCDGLGPSEALQFGENPSLTESRHIQSLIELRPREIAVMNEAEPLVVGKIYRLRFPGIAARVIEPPAGIRSSNYRYLVESLFLRSRWYVNERGEPDNISSPVMVTQAGGHADCLSRGLVTHSH